MLDLLITGGQVVDGTGNVGFYAAVGIEGEMVRVLRGDVSQVQAARRIDVILTDKTGTLTEGRMTLHGVTAGEGVDPDELLALAAPLIGRPRSGGAVSVSMP